jgi:hypothetical protein
MVGLPRRSQIKEEESGRLSTLYNVKVRVQLLLAMNRRIVVDKDPSSCCHDREDESITYYGIIWLLTPRSTLISIAVLSVAVPVQASQNARERG